MVQAFQSHSGNNGSIANDGNMLSGFVLKLIGKSHSRNRRNGSRRMSGAESIEFTFLARRKSGNSVQLAKRIKIIFPSGQDFMRIRLVTDVPNQQIFGRIEIMMQSNRK